MSARAGYLNQLLCDSCRHEVPAHTAVCPYCGARVADPASQHVDPGFLERLGKALGPNFEIEGLLGRGGFADVFAIRDLQLNRTLAVKVLRPEIAWGPWMISRFEREARALANLHHLNIPPIHFVGDNEGLVYYVMPLIEGRSLGDLLSNSGPMDPMFLVDIMIPILEALEHAHLHGIVHRDIKPDNIVIEHGSNRPLLVDFGVAKQVQAGGPGSSLPGVILGTPGYISPEQALGQDNVDARSDIYAVGATIFHVLTGITTFQGETPREIIGKQITGDIPVPSDLNQRIPVWLSEIILCALSRYPEQRFQSAAAMAEALRVGRRGGGSAKTTAGGMIRRIRQDDPTPQMVPVYQPPAPVSPVPNRRMRRSSERRRALPRAGAVIVSRVAMALIGLALAAYFLLIPERFILRNQLLVPVEISANEGPSRVIQPGESYATRMPGNRKMLARWFIVQPRLGETAQAGDPTSGVIRVESITLPELVNRKVIRSVDPWMNGVLSFAPRITNNTGRPLKVFIRNGPGEASCGCLVAAGTSMLLGYYHLRDSTSVRIEDGYGNAVGYTGLEARIDSNTGILDLMIDDTVLSRSPSP
jgi:hypothetical protein